MENAIAGLRASPVSKGFHYTQHRPEQTLPYQLVEKYHPNSSELMTAQGHSLLIYVRREFDEYLKYGYLEHGFLRLRCDACHTEQLLAFSCVRRGFCSAFEARLADYGSKYFELKCS